MAVAAIAGTVAAVATTAAAGYSVYSASQAKKDAKRNAANSASQLGNQSGYANSLYGNMNELAMAGFEANNAIAEDQYEKNMALQEEYVNFLKSSLIDFDGKTGEIISRSSGIADQTYTQIANVIGSINTPSASAFMDEAKSLSMNDFQFRDSIKKGNLNFILGGTQDELRSAQQMNASLAALDENAFTGRMGDVLRSNMYGLKALTVGEASGTFANLSAQNLYNFSQQGLSNSLAMGDFFSREGTIDPISPLQTAFDLENANTNKEFNIAQLGIRNEELKGNTLLGIQDTLLQLENTKLNANQNIANTGLGFGTNAINALGNQLTSSQNALTSQLMSSEAMLAENRFNISNAETAQGYANQSANTNANASMVSAVSGAASALQNYSNSRTQADYYKALQQNNIAKS